MKTLYRSPLPIVILALIAGLWLCTPAVSADPEVRVELNPETFSLHESAILQITVRNAHNADISVPDVDGLSFHPRGKSSQIQVVNGAVDSSIIHSYQVIPAREGTYEIPPITITLDSDTLETEPLSCTVTGSASVQRQPSEPSRTDTGANPAFISFTPDKQTIYRGEVIPATIKVCFRRGTRVSQLNLPRLQGEGLLIDELSNNPRRTEELIDNTAYSVLVWDTFITAVKEGAHPLSFELDATIQIPSRNRSPSPGFGSGFFGDDFFGDMFTGYSSRTITVRSEQSTIDVLPLPGESKPEGFSGAVGSFTLDLEARPTTIEPGEPVTLTMNVAGSGNFASVQPPLISDPGGVKLYTPTAEFSPDQSPHQGTKRFQQAVILTDPSAREIPPVTFSYFDPDAEQYHTLFSDPVPITVNHIHVDNASPPPNPPTPIMTDTKQPAPDGSGGSPSLSLVPVKLETGRHVDRITPPFLSTWYILVVSLSLLAIAGLFGFRFYTTAQQGNEETAHKKAFSSTRKETLAVLSGLNPNAPDYPASARKVLNELLVVHLRADSISLTTAEIETRYGRDSVAAQLFRLGDGALYGKQERSAGTTQELHDQLQTFISELS